MTLIDKLRFHNILTQGGIPEAPSIEFANALDETFDEQISPLATKDDLAQLEQRIVGHINGVVVAAENRLTRLIVNVALGTIGVVAAMIATAVGIILGFN